MLIHGCYHGLVRIFVTMGAAQRPQLDAAQQAGHAPGSRTLTRVGSSTAGFRSSNDAGLLADEADELARCSSPRTFEGLGKIGDELVRATFDGDLEALGCLLADGADIDAVSPCVASLNHPLSQ